jgi:hypothetical protein
MPSVTPAACSPYSDFRFCSNRPLQSGHKALSGRWLRRARCTDHYCAVLLNARRATSDQTQVAVEQPEIKIETPQRLEWVLFAFVPSSLMLGVTTFIATDVASVPLIWIIPLALYLLTFIIAFGNKQFIKLPLTSILFSVALARARRIYNPVAADFCVGNDHAAPARLLSRRAGSHQRLAQSRPPVSKLPEYYLWIAVGGVLGGIFNAILAPMIFSTPFEYPAAIILACLIRPVTNQEQKTKSLMRITFPTFIFVLTFALARDDSTPAALGKSSRMGWCCCSRSCSVLFCSFRRPFVFALSLAALMFASIPYQMRLCRRW